MPVDAHYVSRISNVAGWGLWQTGNICLSRGQLPTGPWVLDRLDLPILREARHVVFFFFNEVCDFLKVDK